MVLMARQGAALELVILNYEYPAVANDHDDSNWLLVRLSVVTPARTWNATGPGVRTFELMQLADWLDGVAANKPVERELELLEPNLRFELAAGKPDAAIINIDFDLEFHPDRPGHAGDPYRCGFELTPKSLREAARHLRAELTSFPVGSAPNLM